MITLTYFDNDGGRGEDCRLALHVAGVAFTDDRVRGSDWMARKPTTPFGSLPVLTVDGHELSQSNAILTWIGRSYGLHPTDPWEAARHEALMSSAEDVRHALAPSLRMKDEAEKKAFREAFADGALRRWATAVEAQIEGPFVAGDRIGVADLKLFVLVGWFARGVVDHVGTDAFGPKLMGLYEAVGAHPRVADWYARRQMARA